MREGESSEAPASRRGVRAWVSVCRGRGVEAGAAEAEGEATEGAEA